MGHQAHTYGWFNVNLTSIRVSKSSKSIEPEPTTNQPKSIGRDTIVNLPSDYHYQYTPILPNVKNFIDHISCLSFDINLSFVPYDTIDR